MPDLLPDKTELGSFQQRACPLCGSQRRKTLGEIEAEAFCNVNSTYRADWAQILQLTPHTRFPIVECEKCQFVFAGQLPNWAFLSLVYEQVIDVEQGKRESLSAGWVAYQLKLASLVLKALTEHFGDSRRFTVLDYGCGYGTMVQALNGPNVHCIGFEVSERRLEYLKSKGLPAISRLEELSAYDALDAIVLSEVLEHVPDPRETLTRCHQLLRDRGLLLVHVPQFSPQRVNDSLAAAAAGLPFTRELNPWEHLNYFYPSTLRRLLQASGFNVEDVPDVVDIGIRPNLRGIRRWGNVVKSVLRSARYALNGSSTTELIGIKTVRK